MTLLNTASPAEKQATDNFAANMAALDATQPDLRPWIAEQHLNVEWLFGRDRTLTAMDEFGQWWSGCSLPRQAARVMLKKLELKGATGCYLAPSHSAQIREALRIFRNEQAIVAVVPDMRDLSLILYCDDFSKDIELHRLWFAAGAGWDTSLSRIFEDHAGLALPSQFIRTPDADADLIEQLIADAQRVFSTLSNDRSIAVETLRQSIPATATSQRVCVVAPSSFRLWNDIGQSMLQAFKSDANIQWQHFNADDPLCSAPMALLKAAHECSAILTANTARTDLPGFVPESRAWITWVTTPRIPSSALAGENDHLVLVDPALRNTALDACWKADRIHIGAWPASARAASRSSGRLISLIADTDSLDTPKDLIEYSSHALLWESIRQEILADPFVLRDINQYLSQRIYRAGIGQDGFPRARFIEKLILPAYQQSLTKILIQTKLPVRVWGNGWESLPEFASIAAGSVNDRDALHAAIDQSCALLHAWPIGIVHPVESMGAPVLRISRRETLLRDAKLAISGKLPDVSVSSPPFSAELILRILRSTTAI
ncbi:MAG TPA: hypothetical protein VHD56_03865 [Tepidisphaeraceae bacterium]|nr:hypothetical protein [Tepidisphaeraceae bacterium]